jgi:hypothetical protein
MRWRDRIRVHPAADMFPMMSQAELKELASDIGEHGLRSGVVFWTPESVENASARKWPEELYLLDGRNRLAAIELAVEDDEERDEVLRYALHIDPLGKGCASLLYSDVDPYAYVVSANIRRRHLTAEQKRDIVAELLRQKPERSDRATAKIANSNPNTVARVRKELEEDGEVSRSDTRVGADGVAQPATRASGPTPEQIHAVTAEKEQSARVMSGTAALGRANLQAVRATASDTMQNLLHLLRLDTAKTLDETIRTLGTAKTDIAAVPREKRIAAARGCLRALGLTDADLRPIG